MLPPYITMPHEEAEVDTYRYVCHERHAVHFNHLPMAAKS